MEVVHLSRGSSSTVEIIRIYNYRVGELSNTFAENGIVCGFATNEKFFVTCCSPRYIYVRKNHSDYALTRPLHSFNLFPARKNPVRDIIFLHFVSSHILMVSTKKYGIYFLSLVSMGRITRMLLETNGNEYRRVVLSDDNRICVGGRGFCSIFSVPQEVQDLSQGIHKSDQRIAVKEEISQVQVQADIATPAHPGDAMPRVTKKRRRSEPDEELEELEEDEITSPAGKKWSKKSRPNSQAPHLATADQKEVPDGEVDAVKRLELELEQHKSDTATTVRRLEKELEEQRRSPKK